MLPISLFLLGTAALGGAQPVIPVVRCVGQQAGTLTLSLVAQVSNPSGRPEPHWVVTPLPSAADIQVPDAELGTAIRDWFQRQGQDNEDGSKKHDWVLDGRNPWTVFNSGLRPALQNSFIIGPFPLISPPAVAGRAVRQLVTFCYSQAKAPYTFRAFDIVVSSRRYNDENRATPLSAPAELRERIPLAITADGVQGYALLSRHDYESPEERDEIMRAFREVANQAWNISQQNGVKPGVSTVASRLELIEPLISDIYSMAHNNVPSRLWQNWPAPKVKFEVVEGVCCTLQVRDVQTVKRVILRVDANLAAISSLTDGTDGAPGPVSPAIPESSPALSASASSTPALPTSGLSASKPNCVADRDFATTRGNQKKADAVARETESILAKRFAGRLSALTNTVPTYGQIDSLRRELASAEEIRPNINLGVSCGNAQEIVFEGDNRFTVIPVAATFGVGYSPESKWIGKTDFAGSNLMLRLGDGSIAKETETLSYAGGSELQKVNARWAVDRTAASSTWTYGFHLSGDFLQDRDQRFGNLTGPVLRDREEGVEPSFVYSFRSSQVDAQLKPVKNTYSISAAAGFRYRHVNIEPAIGSVTPPLAVGSLAALFFDLTPCYRYDPQNSGHGGIGGVDVNLDIHAIRGLPVENFTFTQFLGSVQGSLYFGFAQSRAGLVRFRKGVGTNNGATPLFELFRLGGPDTLRGMEQGEFVGRRLAYEQWDAGLSIREIVRLFHPAPKKLQPEQIPGPVPIDLSKVYVMGFYDRARVTETAGLSDQLAFRHAPKGYGAMLEIQSMAAGTRRLNLGLGYGYSPDSVLHRNGLVVTNVRLDF